MTLLIYFLIVVFILLSGFFSGSETAVISANKFKLKSMSENGKKRKRINFILKLLDNPEKVLSTLLVGNNISVVTVSSLTTMLFIRKYGYKGEFYATIFVSIVILIFGEILPKSIFRKGANDVLLFSYGLLNFFIKMFSPIIKLILFIIEKVPGIRKIKDKPKKKKILTREDLKSIFHISYQQGIIDAENRDILNSIFDFSVTFVREIMVPLVNIVSIPINKKVLDVVDISKKSGYSRIPVYDGFVYNIKGYINVLDLFGAKSNESILKYIRTPYYVPETKMIDDLFIEMNNNRNPIVFVVDEYGGVSGMVTMEDIVEEIIGEIDRKPQEERREGIEKVRTNVWVLSGGVSIDDINDEIGLNLPKKGFETITGFIEFYLSKIPVKKESFIYKGYKFIILDATETCIKKVKIVKLVKKNNKK